MFLETDEQLLTDFVDQFAEMKGPPKYPKGTHRKIKYQTGTRAYNISFPVNDIPSFNSIFGCINTFLLDNQYQPMTKVTMHQMII